MLVGGVGFLNPRRHTVKLPGKNSVVTAPWTPKEREIHRPWAACSYILLSRPHDAELAPNQGTVSRGGSPDSTATVVRNSRKNDASSVTLTTTALTYRWWCTRALTLTVPAHSTTAERLSSADTECPPGHATKAQGFVCRNDVGRPSEHALWCHPPRANLAAYVHPNLPVIPYRHAKRHTLGHTRAGPHKLEVCPEGCFASRTTLQAQPWHRDVNIPKKLATNTSSKTRDHQTVYDRHPRRRATSDSSPSPRPCRPHPPYKAKPQQQKPYH